MCMCRRIEAHACQCARSQDQIPMEMDVEEEVIQNEDEVSEEGSQRDDMYAPEVDDESGSAIAATTPISTTPIARRQHSARAGGALTDDQSQQGSDAGPVRRGRAKQSDIPIVNNMPRVTMVDANRPWMPASEVMNNNMIWESGDGVSELYDHGAAVHYATCFNISYAAMVPGSTQTLGDIMPSSLGTNMDFTLQSIAAIVGLQQLLTDGSFSQSFADGNASMNEKTVDEDDGSQAEEVPDEEAEAEGSNGTSRKRQKKSGAQNRAKCNKFQYVFPYKTSEDDDKTSFMNMRLSAIERIIAINDPNERSKESPKCFQTGSVGTETDQMESIGIRLWMLVCNPRFSDAYTFDAIFDSKYSARKPTTGKAAASGVKADSFAYVQASKVACWSDYKAFADKYMNNDGPKDLNLADALISNRDCLKYNKKLHPYAPQVIFNPERNADALKYGLFVRSSLVGFDYSVVDRIWSYQLDPKNYLPHFGRPIRDKPPTFRPFTIHPAIIDFVDVANPSFERSLIQMPLPPDPISLVSAPRVILSMFKEVNASQDPGLLQYPDTSPIVLACYNSFCDNQHHHTEANKSCKQHIRAHQQQMGIGDGMQSTVDSKIITFENAQGRELKRNERVENLVDDWSRHAQRTIRQAYLNDIDNPSMSHLDTIGLFCPEDLFSILCELYKNHTVAVNNLLQAHGVPKGVMVRLLFSVDGHHDVIDTRAIQLDNIIDQDRHVYKLGDADEENRQSAHAELKHMFKSRLTPTSKWTILFDMLCVRAARAHSVPLSVLQLPNEYVSRLNEHLIECKLNYIWGDDDNSDLIRDRFDRSSTDAFNATVTLGEDDNFNAMDLRTPHLDRIEHAIVKLLDGFVARPLYLDCKPNDEHGLIRIRHESGNLNMTTQEAFNFTWNQQYGEDVDIALGNSTLDELYPLSGFAYDDYLNASTSRYITTHKRIRQCITPPSKLDDRVYYIKSEGKKEYLQHALWMFVAMVATKGHSMPAAMHRRVNASIHFLNELSSEKLFPNPPIKPDKSFFSMFINDETHVAQKVLNFGHGQTGIGLFFALYAGSLEAIMYTHKLGIYIFGPKGLGKTTLFEQLHKLLLDGGVTMGSHDISDKADTHGRNVYDGGLYCIDEDLGYMRNIHNDKDEARRQKVKANHTNHEATAHTSAQSVEGEALAAGQQSSWHSLDVITSHTEKRILTSNSSYGYTLPDKRETSKQEEIDALWDRYLFWFYTHNAQSQCEWKDLMKRPDNIYLIKEHRTTEAISVLLIAMGNSIPMFCPDRAYTNALQRQLNRRLCAHNVTPMSSRRVDHLHRHVRVFCACNAAYSAFRYRRAAARLLGIPEPIGGFNGRFDMRMLLDCVPYMVAPTPQIVGTAWELTIQGSIQTSPFTDLTNLSMLEMFNLSPLTHNMLFTPIPKASGAPSAVGTSHSASSKTVANTNRTITNIAINSLVESMNSQEVHPSDPRVVGSSSRSALPNARDRTSIIPPDKAIVQDIANTIRQDCETKKQFIRQRLYHSHWVRNGHYDPKNDEFLKALPGDVFDFYKTNNCDVLNETIIDRRDRENSYMSVGYKLVNNQFLHCPAWKLYKDIAKAMSSTVVGQWFKMEGFMKEQLVLMARMPEFQLKIPEVTSTSRNLVMSFDDDEDEPINTDAMMGTTPPDEDDNSFGSLIRSLQQNSQSNVQLVDSYSDRALIKAASQIPCNAKILHVHPIHFEHVGVLDKTTQTLVNDLKLCVPIAYALHLKNQWYAAIITCSHNPQLQNHKMGYKPFQSEVDIQKAIEHSSALSSENKKLEVSKVIAARKKLVECKIGEACIFSEMLSFYRVHECIIDTLHKTMPDKHNKYNYVQYYTTLVQNPRDPNETLMVPLGEPPSMPNANYYPDKPLCDRLQFDYEQVLTDEELASVQPNREWIRTGLSNGRSQPHLDYDGDQNTLPEDLVVSESYLEQKMSSVEQNTKDVFQTYHKQILRNRGVSFVTNIDHSDFAQAGAEGYKLLFRWVSESGNPRNCRSECNDEPISMVPWGNAALKSRTFKSEWQQKIGPELN